MGQKLTIGDGETKGDKWGRYLCLTVPNCQLLSVPLAQLLHVCVDLSHRLIGEEAIDPSVNE